MPDVEIDSVFFSIDTISNTTGLKYLLNNRQQFQRPNEMYRHEEQFNDVLDGSIKLDNHISFSENILTALNISKKT